MLGIHQMIRSSPPSEWYCCADQLQPNAPPRVSLAKRCPSRFRQLGREKSPRARRRSKRYQAIQVRAAPYHASRSSTQLDLFPVRAAEDDPAPFFLARLSSGRGMGRTHDWHPSGLQLRDGRIEAVGLKTEVEAGHRSFRTVRELQHGVAKLQVCNARSSRDRLLSVIFEAEMAFVKRDGSLKVRHVQSNVIYSLVHGRGPLCVSRGQALSTDYHAKRTSRRPKSWN